MKDLRIGTILSELYKVTKGKVFYTIELTDQGILQFKTVKPQNQATIVKSIFGLLFYHLENDQLDANLQHYYRTNITSDRTSRLFNHSQEVDREIFDAITSLSEYQFFNNIQNVLYSYLNANPAVQDRIILQLLDFCERMVSVGIEKYNFSVHQLHKYRLFQSSNQPMDTDQLISDLASSFEKCLRIGLTYSNKKLDSRNPEFRQVGFIERKKLIGNKINPNTQLITSNFSENRLRTTAPTFLLYSDDADAFRKEFHIVPDLLKCIRDNGLLLQNLNITQNHIEILVKKPKGDYILRYCESENDITNCLRLIHDTKHYYRPKITWESYNYDLEILATQLFLEKPTKWRTIAYFSKYRNQEIVCAFTMVTLSIIGSAEIGLAACSPDYYDDDLLRSLLIYDVLEYIDNPLFSGINSDNQHFIRCLESSGFQPRYFTDKANKAITTQVLERYSDLDHLDELTGYTTYFQRPSLRQQIFEQII